MSNEIKEEYIHPNDGRVTAIPAARPDTSLPEHEQDQNIAGSFPARPGAQDIPPHGMSATGGLPSSGPADQGAVAPQSATGTHGVTGTGYPHVGTAQSGSSVGRGLAGSERSVGQDTELSESLQDAALDGTYGARPGVQSSTPAGPRSGVDGRGPAVSNTAHVGAVSSPSHTGPSTTLSEREQDANLAGSFVARPGNKDATPAGLSSTTHTGTPEVNNSALPGSVKSSLDSVADSAAPKSVAGQLPTTESIKEQLPTTQQATETAQQAAESVARGASSLLSGLGSLVLGAGNATAQTAAQPHPESEKASDVDDLHIPGAFESETSDREDVNAVKQALPSTEQISRNLPDANTARAKVTGSERPIVDQASDAARPAQDTVSRQIPSANTARANVTGSERTIVDQASDTARSAQNQVPDANTARANVTGSERPLVDQASDAARAAQEQAQQGLNYAKEQVFGQTSANKVTPSSTGRGLNAPASSQAQAPSHTTSSGVSSGLPSGPSTLGQTQPTVTTGIASAEAPKVSVKDGPAAREVPDLVAESHRKAGETAPLDLPAYNAGEEQHKSEALEQSATGATSSSSPSNNGAGITGTIAGGLAAAGTAVAGAAEYARQQTHQATGTDPATILPESAQKAIDPQTAANTSDASLQRGEAPGVVQESQNAAGVAPEASANPFAVQEKNDVEAELKRAVEPAQASSENNIVTRTLASAGAAAAEAARSAQEQISRSIPDANTARVNVTGSERPVTEQVSRQIPDANTARANVTGPERPFAEQAQDAAARARETVQQVASNPASILPVSAQQALGQNTSTGQDYPSIPSNHKTDSHLTPSSGPEPGTGVAPLASNSDSRPTHAGTAPGIPRTTVESSAAPDVSYEHRPKTLPHSEIAAREQERGLGEGTTTTTSHEPIAFQPVSGAIHGGLANVNLHAGVHNGVVGVGSAHPLGSSQQGHGLGAAGVLSQATSAEPKEDVVVGHIGDDLEHVDLSQGVRNGVIGRGSQNERTH
ncbi:hypothetical protein CLAFUW4_09966 [Fulvia fulva]|uniref:Uncharacterized protein n=1 Tax=Passalora fulva TaxID=5499 RepID=A0A9Q8UUG4_PASFU|nr:uncharacterized protein CLAFUR5_12277 [Fulvia fulva]KAK4615557.1 hypothetical protein CLAFUR4_09970 [Fulvia fulva]KAK4617225.1 hypothetical protein CLAFUR0_09967 [Fulvia fulva]UJO22883.1 hypothetical protein CLAFUR5_12277 [Fulvia fulva]WPV19104.1 hypothetical protein CLAFUW4_09966 [Fulvia fulva]WPV34151.1 hypothetical protein CLAFUW7_09967 [Fulvia fulva]